MFVKDHRESPQSSSGSGDLARYSGYGITWVLTTLLLGWGGLVLDERFGTSPLLVISGAVLGLVGGFVSLYTRTVAQPADREGVEPRHGGKHQ